MVSILGISAFYHDSAACLVRDGEIVAAAQEERFTRIKHDKSFPTNAVRFCLDQSGLEIGNVDHVVFYDKPLLTFERLLETYIDFAPRGFRSFIRAMPVWLTEKLWTRETIARKTGFEGTVLFTEHHESHAASAFYPSPFESAAILTMDGVGEWATSSYGVGRGDSIELFSELRFPHSIGLLYSAFTYFTGFKVNSGEYKLMGLAPYGEPVYVQTILDDLVDLRDDGSLRLNMDHFSFATGLTMTNSSFDDLFGGPPRKPESEITRREMDIARSIQEVTEMVMLRMANHVYQETGEKNLCLAGGCALNCVGNGRILRESPFENIWIQPAAGDAGGAIGAALSVWHQYLGNKRVTTDADADAMKGAYLGPEFVSEEAAAELLKAGAVFTRMNEPDLTGLIASELASGKVIGWFQGRMEFGPRALGNRSILGDPRSPELQRQLNLKIKKRESFRPFAPAVLRERVSDFFELDTASPYMLLVAPVDKNIRLETNEHSDRGLEKLHVRRSTIPAVTHVDLSARIQTVDSSTNRRFYDLIRKFDELTGVPVLINTSFNVRGEPIVCTPTDAFACFMRTEMDLLVIDDIVLQKSDQDKALSNLYTGEAQVKELVQHKRMRGNHPTKQVARKTAIVVAIVLIGLSAVFAWRGRSTAAAVASGLAVLLLLSGFFVPSAAIAFHRVWMSIAFVLGWINSRIILTILYFLVFVPYGLVSRLAGRDPLDLRSNKTDSFWRKRTNTKQTKEGFERLF